MLVADNPNTHQVGRAIPFKADWIAWNGEVILTQCSNMGTRAILLSILDYLAVANACSLRLI